MKGVHQGVQVLLHAVGDAQQDQRALGDAGLAPGYLGGVGGVQRQLDVGLVGAGDLAQRLAGDRGQVFEVAAIDRRQPAATDEVVVAGFQVQAVLGRGNGAHRLSPVVLAHLKRVWLQQCTARASVF
ncbi:hypothetical protein D3C78_1525820 [compost metagenome]